jgi:hypothetical protein
MHTVPSTSVSAQIVPPSDQVLAQQFYQQLSTIEDQMNYYYSCPGIVGPCTSGVVADCSLPATAVGLLQAGFIKAGLAAICLYASFSVGAEVSNVSCVPFCFTNMLLEERKNSMSNAAIPAHWRIDPNVNALLQSWQSELAAQPNTGNINLQQLSTDNVRHTVNDVVAAKAMIANVYRTKYKQTIDEGIKQNENTHLIMQ